MNYVGRLFSSVKTFYSEINPATLTGAIDVIVVQQPDGSLKCSPFHVRFGKMGVLRSREKVVDIQINGEPVDLYMKLGENGEAFFVEELEDEDIVPDHLATSPIPSQSTLFDEGMKELHSGKSRHSRSGTESSRDSESGNVTTKTISSSNLRGGSNSSSGLGSEAKDVGSIMHHVSEKLADITQESLVGHGQENLAGNGHGQETLAGNGQEDLLGNHQENLTNNAQEKLADAAQEKLADVAQEKLTDVAQEESMDTAKPKDKKKLTKTKNSLKSVVKDVEAGSSQEEDSTSKADHGHNAALGLNSNPLPHHEDSVTMETEIKKPSANISSRSRVRAKRRRKKSGKAAAGASGGKADRTLPQNPNIRRATTRSESSTSSSQRSDEDEIGGIFPIDDVEDEEDEEVEEEGKVLTVSRVETVTVMEEEVVWSNLNKPTQRTFHGFSDGDYTPLVSPQATRPPTPKSDTEAENQRQSSLRQANKVPGAEKIEWNWGELPEQSVDPKRSADLHPSPSTPTLSGQSKLEEKRPSIWSKIWNSKNQDPKEGGMYLQDLASEEVDPEVYALYFPESSSQVPPNRIRAIQETKDEDKSSDLGNSLPQSPNTVATPAVSDSESHHGCADLHYNVADLQQGVENGTGSNETAVAESLRGMQLSLCGGLKVDEDAIPMEHFKKHLVSYEDFTKDPSMLTNPKLVLRINNKFFNWQMAGPIIISQLAFRKPLPVDVATNLMKDSIPKGKRSLTSWFWGSSAKPTTPKKEYAPTDDLLIQQEEEERPRNYSMDSGPNSADELDLTTEGASGSPPRYRRQSGFERYRKAIRLSSEQLAKLNLQPGPNEIRYSVTTRYQGTSVCESTIYLWNYKTKIIISDIDGTITKSDVFGQILPVLGKDWTHLGVAQLYSDIKLNGYNFLYLSSRAIGQARLTKGYLNSIQQDKSSLPDGPLLLNPSSLFSAFHSEVIIRKPEEFKIKCLQDIEHLFPPSTQPCYAGFGNRINDTWAYRAVGIPVSHIFTINPHGKLTHEMTKTFQSSYPKMKDLVDHVFPPLHRQTRMAFEAPAEYSTFTYWRNPVPDLPPDDEFLQVP